MEMGSNSFLENCGKKTCLNKNGENSGSGGSGGSSGKKQQVPRCQVEGCSVDLSGAKAYYGRHKVCGTHSKTPMVIVAGLQQRFCQQCSRFHKLAEFDHGKRSCRRRLAGHNERRRKPPLSASLSPFFRDNSSSRLSGFLMNFAHPNQLERYHHPVTSRQFSDTNSAFSLLSTNPNTNATAPSNNSFVSFGFQEESVWLPNELKLDNLEINGSL